MRNVLQAELNGLMPVAIENQPERKEQIKNLMMTVSANMDNLMGITEYTALFGMMDMPSSRNILHDTACKQGVQTGAKPVDFWFMWYIQSKELEEMKETVHVVPSLYELKKAS